MEMIFLEEESEISVVDENLHDASAKNAKNHFVEDNDMPAAVPGLEEVGSSCCRDTAVFLLCFVSLTGLILSVSSVNLFVYMSKTITRSNSNSELKTVLLQTSYNNMSKDKEQLQVKYEALTKERNDLQTKLEDIEASFKNLTEETDKLKENLNDFASEGWVYFRGSLYNISATVNTWENSRQHCRQKGVDLVIINSKEEQEFITQFEKNMWIGLTDSETEGTWQWVDGTPLTTRYWNTGEPNNRGDEDCAEILYYDNEKSWNDRKCSQTRLWMCEKRVLP